MKNKITLVMALAVALWGTNVFARGHGHGGHGKPDTTGLEHAEDTANAHGQKGIENAEEKQAEHKTHKSKKHHHDGKKDSDKGGNKDKH